MKTIQTALLAMLALAALAALNLLRYRTHGADYIDAYLRPPKRPYTPGD